jgi:hypothetical protein
LLQFAKVIYPQERCLAWVRIYDGVNIDHAKRVASYTREGRCCWIEVGWIKSLLGVIKEGGVNLLVTDVDLFALCAVIRSVILTRLTNYICK